MADQRHDAAFVVGAILGGLAGAAAVLFRAPQSGAQTRAQLAERWNAAAEQAAQAVAAADGRARELATRAGEGVAPVIERIDRVRPGGAEATAPAAVEADVAVEIEVDVDEEPVFTLPDPLEPDPVVAPPPPAADLPTALDPPATDLGAAPGPAATADGPRAADERR